MATLKEGEYLLTSEEITMLTEHAIAIQRMFEVIPFDGIPGGDLSYTEKKVSEKT